MWILVSFWRWPFSVWNPLRRIFLKTSTFFALASSSTTVALTTAPSTYGVPTVTAPASSMRSTLSNSTDSPLRAGRRFTKMSIPASTLNCWLAMSTIAYISKTLLEFRTVSGRAPCLSLLELIGHFVKLDGKDTEISGNCKTFWPFRFFLRFLFNRKHQNTPIWTSTTGPSPRSAGPSG